MTTTISDIVEVIGGIVNLLLPLVIGIAVLVFIWGLVKYLTSAGDEEGQKGARSLMIWGVIIIFVMVSIWGLVNLLGNTFGIETDSAPPAPNIPSVPADPFGG